jgi:putative transposase
MELREYKANNHVVDSNQYPVVGCPKDRRKVLEGKIACRLRPILVESCLYDRAEIIALAIMPDHVHCFVAVDARLGVHRLSKNRKGDSSHVRRKEFPVLQSRLPTLGTNSYLISPVGGAPRRVLKRYVENQKNV